MYLADMIEDGYAHSITHSLIFPLGLFHFFWPSERHLSTSHIHIDKYTFITGLSALSLTIACPLWSPVRDLGSPRDLWRGETKLRELIRGVLLGRGAGVRALLATCA